MKKSIAIILALCLLLTPFALAHGGRTDSNEGHKDNKNASGLGSYHYHCGGNPAHLHENGVCPYDDAEPEPEPTPKPIKTPKPTATPKPSKTANQNKSAVSGELTVHFIDVGQADSILIVTPTGKAILIDAGNNGDGNLVKKYIQAQKIKKIDILVGTHPHEDHIGGLDTVINAFDIGNIFMPRATATSKTYEDVLTAIQKKGLKVNTAKAGVSVALDGEDALKIDFIAPNSSDYDNLNDWSAVIKLTYGKTSFLFAGDAEDISEKEILLAGHNVKADLLKVGHHGSETATSAGFLKAVSPSIAIIMCGEDNNYGHPHAGVLTRLDAAKAKTYRTDLNGTIVVTSDGTKLTVK